MANISDIIEQFILDTMEDSGSIEISRNSLADYFNCAPSQINYVLDTRFTLDRGFSKESKRGGGGFIKINRMKEDDTTAMILESVGEELSYNRMMQILKRLGQEKIISKSEQNIIRAALCDEALSLPLLMRDKMRANAFKSVLIELMRGDK
ncbi:MAG: CtsR family transcriptional regulator [Clostridia bacterium]|nr:CtsR family transcriptional regulator [Clostridia bacterium]